MDRRPSIPHPDGGWQHYCQDCNKPVEIAWWRQFDPPSDARCITHQMQHSDRTHQLLIPSSWE